MRGEASIHVDAPAERIWRLITDVTRMGEWSPVTYRCEWLGDAIEAKVGARFKGYNRMPPARWWTICEVTEADPGKVFEFRTIDVSKPFSVGVKPPREMTRWRYSFEPDGIGTKVTETYDVSFTPPILGIPERIVRAIGGGAAMDRRRAQTDRGIVQTLRRLKVAAEG